MRLLVMCALLACGSAAKEEPIVSTSSETTPTALNARHDVSIDALIAALEHAPMLIDVRTPEEFESGHVKGAINFPISKLDPTNPRLTPLKGTAPIYVICESGGRSARGADQFASAGYETFNVTGGMRAWRKAGHPMEK